MSPVFVIKKKKKIEEKDSVNNLSSLKILSKLKSITLKKISDITVKYSAQLISYQLIQYFFMFQYYTIQKTNVLK